MKVLLIKDVYKLGHAGDIKRVADGYGRNYLLPQGLAVLATPGAVKQADHIRKEASEKRALLNQEKSGLAGRIEGMRLTFAMKAGETGKLYGSITHEMIAKVISEKLGSEIDRRQVEVEPIRKLGEHSARIRLTVDLNPHITIHVHREGEAPAFTTDLQPQAGKKVADAVSAAVDESEAE
ncbi:MAG: 50S ribosomal protein L9 [Anaerolineaceae bacterium]|jgi:large subunit ribosomal protein L9